MTALISMSTNRVHIDKFKSKSIEMCGTVRVCVRGMRKKYVMPNKWFGCLIFRPIAITVFIMNLE